MELRRRPPGRRPDLHRDARDDPSLPGAGRGQGQGLHQPRRDRGQDPRHRRRDRGPHRDRVVAPQGGAEDHRDAPHQPHRADRQPRGVRRPRQEGRDGRHRRADPGRTARQGSRAAEAQRPQGPARGRDRGAACDGVADRHGAGAQRHAGARDRRSQEGRQHAHPGSDAAGARDILELPISKIVE